MLEAREQAKNELKKLANSGTTSFATDQVAALQAAIEQFEQYRSSSAWAQSTIAEVVLVSDMQSGESIDRLRTLQWPKDLR